VLSLSRISHSHSTGKFDQEEKLIIICSKVARIEQQMNLLETNAAASQSHSDIPAVPKHIMVGVFVNV
jgi:hypothetical protein